MRLARLLVAGVDVWLNTPHRPLEASGTSGMKALLGGVPNLSVLDGWWIEGYNGANGWAIGQGFSGGDEDAYDAESLYTLLENTVAPLYYDRGDDGLPHAWIEVMKRSIRTLCPVYNTDRMVAEYAENFYLNSISKFSVGKL